MKYILQKLVVTATILVLSVSTWSQTKVPPIQNLGNFHEIGKDELIVYFVNATNILRTPFGIVMETLAANYQNAPTIEDPDAYQLNNQAYIVTTWKINCKERTGERIEDKGLWKGKKVKKTFKHPKLEKPDKSRNLWFAIDAVCGDTSPELQQTVFVKPDTKTGYVWKGGNGCNLIGGGENEKLCCVEHDFKYRTGGGERQRWQADSELFKCVWRRNKFLAPVVFVGARVGGLFAFHWGKRRALERNPQSQK